ncbi:AraC family transcriptional regulator [Pseudomonas oryzihabitans]|uniref:AraC family transcriptional regulator n=1 Tax=Pseudomonas oryzihabitans TaxID=47885 RepID=A0A4Y5W2Q1_9PSED|nr:AraC family transcriptional regulator [Pseudomonas psychrotolerans]QDD88751.1 AraC family transcriptional regulator [Pseudomonas psychrotolerans]
MKRPALRLGDLSTGFVLALAAAVNSRGGDADALLVRFGLSPARLAEPGGRLSIPHYMRLGHAALEVTGDPALGLAMGRAMRPAFLGLAGVTVAQAPDVRHAAETLLHLEPLYGRNYRGQSRWAAQGRDAWLHFYSISPYNDYNRFVVDAVLGAWLALLGAVAGQALQPRRVLIEYAAPADPAPYEAAFGCAVEFGATENALLLDTATLALPGTDHCPATWRQLLALSEAEHGRLTRTRGLTERVVEVMGPLLRHGEPTLEQIATRLRLPSWTLRRKLAEEGTQYRALLNLTRRDLALAYIRDTEASFGEIAYLLGFASPAAFQRAFKRWTEQTPGDWRRNARLA